MLSIEFTSANSENVVWRGDMKVVVTHNLGCYPIVNVYDSLRQPVLPVIRIVSKDAFSMDFSKTGMMGDGETWLCVIVQGSDCTMEYEEDVEEMEQSSSQEEQYDPVPPELFDSESPDPRYSISHRARIE